MTIKTKLVSKLRVVKPDIVVSRRASQEAIDTQLDLEKMLGAAVVEQAKYFRAIHGSLMKMAITAFVNRHRSVHEPSDRTQMYSHIERVTKLFAATRLLGRVRVKKELDLPTSVIKHTFSEVLGQVGVDQAVAYLENLPVSTPEEWRRLIQEGGRAAFTAAGIESQAALEALKKLVAQALAENWTRPEFEDRATELLRTFETEAGTLRTLWNMTTSTAMQKGREDIFTDPEVQKSVPYWLYDAILDNRVRPNHAALDGAIAPISWERWWGPRGLRSPNGINCRCTMVGLSVVRAKKMIESGAPYFDATEGIDYGGPDFGFVKLFAEGGRVCCEPDAGWEKAA
jgi:SPP1 gp7 family putative phage head morphogenesis protein